MLRIGSARHPGPSHFSRAPNISVELINIGGWSYLKDLALQSQAHFLAFAEHRLIRARAGGVTTQLMLAHNRFGRLCVRILPLQAMQVLG